MTNLAQLMPSVENHNYTAFQNRVTPPNDRYLKRVAQNVLLKAIGQTSTTRIEGTGSHIATVKVHAPTIGQHIEKPTCIAQESSHMLIGAFMRTFAAIY